MSKNDVAARRVTAGLSAEPPLILTAADSGIHPAN